MKNADRNTNHELLRLLAMYMIVFIHANMYLFDFCTGLGGVFFNGLVNGICNIGVSCFILISGYYGVKFELRKLVKMECMMISYSLLEMVILCVVMPEQMQGAALLEQLVKSFLPFITRKYWFYSSYVCLLLLSIYIQKLIDCLEEKEFRKLLILMVLLFSVLPTAFYFELIPDNGKGLVQMIMLYMVGRYIRLYRNVKISAKTFLLFGALWLLNGISHEFPIRLGGIYHHLCKDNSITNLIMAVVLFCLFKELQIKSARMNKIINKTAAYVFAVFALNNSLTACAMKLITGSGFQSPDGVLGFLTLAGVVFLIWAGCLAVGFIRELLLGRLDEKIGLLAVRVGNRAARK